MFWRRFSSKSVIARDVEWLLRKPDCCWLNKLLVTYSFRRTHSTFKYFWHACQYSYRSVISGNFAISRLKYWYYFSDFCDVRKATVTYAFVYNVWAKRCQKIFWHFNVRTGISSYPHDVFEYNPLIGISVSWGLVGDKT